MIDFFTWIFQGGWWRGALVSVHWGPFVFTEGKHPGIHKSSLTEFRSPTKFPSDHLSSFAGLIVFQSKWVNWRTFSSAGGRLDLCGWSAWGWVCGDLVSGVWQDPCGRCCQVRLISTKKLNVNLSCAGAMWSSPCRSCEICWSSTSLVQGFPRGSQSINSFFVQETGKSDFPIDEGF